MGVGRARGGRCLPKQTAIRGELNFPRVCRDHLAHLPGRAANAMFGDASKAEPERFEPRVPDPLTRRQLLERRGAGIGQCVRHRTLRVPEQTRATREPRACREHDRNNHVPQRDGRRQRVMTALLPRGRSRNQSAVTAAVKREG